MVVSSSMVAEKTNKKNITLKEKKEKKTEFDLKWSKRYIMALIEVSQGSLKGGKGVTDNGTPYYEFLGVPYAKPPLGNLRFKIPEPPEKWSGIFDATSYREINRCAQKNIITQTIVGSEDCLYLNVFTPKLPESNSKSLPVMVFIHGGGFGFGNGINKEEQGPDYLIERDVVLVSINYRLGVLGFLCLDIPEAAGNMGLKDQVQALKWVQENIDKFGGDSHNITLFGGSAGSASVEYHILSPLSKGLFHKAILQSGSALNPWAINDEPRKIVLELLEKMGYNGSINDNNAIFKYLTTSDLNTLMQEANAIVLAKASIYFGFVPTVEKDFGNENAMITELPYKLLKSGRFNRVPVIAGVCEKEGYIMFTLNPQPLLEVTEKKNFADHWNYKINAYETTIINKNLSSVYSKSSKPDDDDDKIGVDFFSDFYFAAGSCLRGELLANKGVPVYFYEFLYDGNTNQFKKNFEIKRKGATHCDECGYIFKLEMSKLAQEKDVAMRNTITKLWTNFAKSGNPTPNKDLNIEWPDYRTEPACLNIDEKLTIQRKYIPKRMDTYKIMYDKYGK